MRLSQSKYKFATIISVSAPSITNPDENKDYSDTQEDVTWQATKEGSLLSTIFWSQKERAPSYPVQGYHQEKPEA